MDNPSFGSGGQITGGMDAVQAALSRRAQGGSQPALTQVSGSAPQAQPANMPSQGPTMPSGAPQMAQPSPTPSMGLPTGSPEAETILKALSSRLATLNKLQLGQ